MDFPGGLDVGSNSVPVTGVKFVGCRFHGTDPTGKLVGLWGDATFEYCTFVPTDEPPPPIAYEDSYQYGIECDGGFGTHGRITARFCEAYGYSNVAFDINGDGHLIQDTWIHDASADGGIAHTDGIGSLSGSGACSNVTIDHNLVESLGNTNALAFQGGVWSDFTITYNIFGGYGDTIAFIGTTSGIDFTDNLFRTTLQVGFGPLYGSVEAWWTDANGGTWRRNLWDVPAGAPGWGQVKNSGKFWLPVIIDVNNGDTDDLCTSTSDYAGS